MQVLLLIAGQSKRFWPLKEKSLFPVCGKTLLEHQLERLRAAGLNEITLVGGAHNLEQIRNQYPGLPTIEQENLDLGIRGALLSALPHCGNEPVMVVSGNDVIDSTGYKALLAKSAEKGVAGALLAYKVDSYFPGGYLTLDGDRVSNIMEKPGEGNEPSDLVNLVAHIHNEPAALLKALEDIDMSDDHDDAYERALQSLFQSHVFHAVSYEGFWQAVKYPWHLLDLLPTLLQEIDAPKIHPSASVHDTAVITGPVILEEGVRVMAHATIVGPCFIGKNSIVANNALVRGASVGNHCVIGYGTEIKESVLHSHVWTHMSYVGDSVIGRNVSFGGGAMVGNFRLDEQEIHSVVNGNDTGTNRQKFGTAIGDNCRLGIHMTINPGIKIGGGSFVSSGVLLEEDVIDASFVRIKDGKVTRSENRTSAPDPEAREQYYKKVN